MNDNAEINGCQYAYPGERFEYTLTKRELFAAMAMQGLLACPKSAASTPEDFAIDAIASADALLNALEESSHE